MMSSLGYSVEHYVVLAGALFTIGGVGFLVRRNVLVPLMSIELMLNAVNLTLVAFNRQHMADHDRAGVRLLHHRRRRGRSRRGPRHRALLFPAEVQRPVTKPTCSSLNP